MEPDATTLILHGRVSDIGKWPWHAVLYLLEEGNWTFSCGGTIITERVVITGNIFH